MKKYLGLSLLMVGFLFSHSTNVSAQCPIMEQILHGDDDTNSGNEVNNAMHENRILIIYYDAEKGDKAIKKAVKKKKCEIVCEYKEFNNLSIKSPVGWDIEKAIAYFNKVKGVTNVRRNGISRLQR